MATLCPQCGHRNRDGALICSHCSARLGAEPTASTSFGALGAGRAAPVSPLDDLRVDSDAAPLHRATREASDQPPSRERRERGEGGDARTGWIVAGLSFFGVLVAAGAYWWSTEQGPTQVPVRDAAAAPPAAPAPNVGLPPASVPAPAPVAQTPAAPSALQALSLEPRPNPAPAPRPASAPPPPPPPPASRMATAPLAAPRAEAPAPRRRAATEAPPRRAPARDGPMTQNRPSIAAAESDGSAWPPVGREPANTSAPNYSDAGPPVVAGPGPRYQTAPGPAPSPTWTPAPRPAADPDAIPMPAVTGGDPGRRR
jgi:hypothetical protein